MMSEMMRMGSRGERSGAGSGVRTGAPPHRTRRWRAPAEWICGRAPRFLAVKLDYQEILAAWSDRGPLYTDGDRPQVVPDLHHQIYTHFESSIFPVLVEVSQGGGASPWKVPEAERDENGCEELVKKEVISREARVNRYKEKRGNRLFAKRIRYEFRKMNAEKRLRIKGRFVKRKHDNEDHS